MQQWIKSSGHRANMLRKDINKYGMASATSASGRRYWALEVGE
ncbi:MAG: CAP domain-containing protein [Pseudomonadota bacterium]